MKKLIAFLLTLAMLAALGMNALAESELSGTLTILSWYNETMR